MTESLLDLHPTTARARLSEWLTERGEPRFRIQQIGEFLAKRVADPERMGNVPRPLREALREELLPPVLELETLQESTDGTRKLRFRLDDGAAIESVWIPSEDRATLCVSSQAGCPVKCTFCATGAAGYRRNLRPSEILAQWLDVNALAADSWPPGHVTQIVFMGMGEPLLNYEALRVTLAGMTSAEGFAFSPRRITVSTVGVVSHIPELLREFPQVRLALSLHSAVDETRSEIIPLNRKWPVESLRDALRGEASSRYRRVTLEYVHLEGINDTDAEARALARFARDTGSHVNLLPFHPYPGAPYTASDPAAVREFRNKLLAHFDGEVTIRKSRGLDISGACGQLVLEKLGGDS